MAESVVGLYEAECVRPGGPFRTVADLELASLSWVQWFNEQRLHSALGYVPPPSARLPTTVRSTPDSSRCREN